MHFIFVNPCAYIAIHVTIHTASWVPNIAPTISTSLTTPCLSLSSLHSFASISFSVYSTRYARFIAFQFHFCSVLSLRSFIFFSHKSLRSVKLDIKLSLHSLESSSPRLILSAHSFSALSTLYSIVHSFHSLHILHVNSIHQSLRSFFISFLFSLFSSFQSFRSGSLRSLRSLRFTISFLL